MKKIIKYSVIIEIIFLLLTINLIKAEYNSTFHIIENNNSNIFDTINSNLYAFMYFDYTPKEIEKHLKLVEDSLDTKNNALYNYGIKLYDKSGNAVIKYLYKTDTSLEKKVIEISDKIKSKTLISKSGNNGDNHYSYEINDEFRTKGYSLYLQIDKKKTNLFIIKSMTTSILILVTAQIVIILAFVAIVKKYSR